jgi:uncharacterized peroxidase-related enzyme
LPILLGFGLVDLFRTYPGIYRPLQGFHEALLRGPSPLTVAERELIAAYVSRLNECEYCHGVHSATARTFGVPAGTLEALLAGNEMAGDRMKPVLSYAAKLTRTPAKVTPSDADAVLPAGWDARALHDLAAICGLFNLMNRLVHGLGIAAGEDYFELAARRLADGGYAELI